MKNPERIKKIRQFLDLANGKLGHAPDQEITEGLAMVLAGHVNELLIMMEEEETLLAKQLTQRFFGSVLPREEPKPVLTADVVSDYDDYGMYDFGGDEAGIPYVPPYTLNEPTADEILKHTKSCDFRRGLKKCTCLG